MISFERPQGSEKRRMLRASATDYAPFPLEIKKTLPVRRMESAEPAGGRSARK